MKDQGSMGKGIRLFHSKHSDMNRFKFRAWDKETKKMVINIEPFKNDFAVGTPLGNDWVIMQCTGLKDKNGTLIYEGDVLTPGGVVEFDDEIARYVLRSNEGSSTFSCDMHKDYEKEQEIIGNIYENPELLDKE